MTALYDIPVTTIDGRQTTLAEHKGKVLLVVNVASKCGLTPQYEALEKLHQTYSGQGFAVLGFPANDFAAQEPGTDAEIKSFCSTNYGVTFPMFSKIAVKGDAQHALYRELITEKPKATPKQDGSLKETLEKHGLGPTNDTDVMWNFEKFLVSRDGKAVARFAPDIAPDATEVKTAVESELAK